MTKFANDNNIKLQKIPPLHPSSNPAKTFKRPLENAMKIAQMSKHPEEDTLKQTSAMLFRDDKQTSLPR